MIDFALCSSLCNKCVFTCSTHNEKKKKKSKGWCCGSKSTASDDLVNEIEYMRDTLTPHDVILNRILEQMRRLVKADYFVLQKINSATQSITLKIINRDFAYDCDEAFTCQYLPPAEQGKFVCSSTSGILARYNLFGALLEAGERGNGKRYLISNNLYEDPRAVCRFPDGHPMIRNFFGIPFCSQGRVYAIIAFANSKRGFRDSDYTKLKPVVNVLNGCLDDLLDFQVDRGVWEHWEDGNDQDASVASSDEAPSDVSTT
jgi:GAF domain-containing protein